MGKGRSLALPALLLGWSAISPAPAAAELYEYQNADGSVLYTNVRQVGRRGKVAFFPARSSRVYRTPESQRDRSPERFTRYDAYVVEAARLYQLPVAFLRAVIHIESDFDPNVVSVDGAMGLMQLMPMTAQKMGVENPFDPRQNILGGARFLRILANQWQGDLVLTVASYNAGAGAVERYGGVPPYAETRRYVNRVIRRYYEYREGRALGPQRDPVAASPDEGACPRAAPRVSWRSRPASVMPRVSVPPDLRRRPCHGGFAQRTARCVAWSRSAAEPRKPSLGCFATMSAAAKRHGHPIASRPLLSADIFGVRRENGLVVRDCLERDRDGF
jgi:hypothetical protein